MNAKYNLIKKCKIILIVFFLAIIILTFNSISEASNGYTIQSYDVDMTVNENNTFDITEKIVVDFTGIGKHGIYRYLPLMNKIKRTDGTTSKNRAKVSDVEVSENYTKSTFGGTYTIKIGNANQTVSGIHEYTIKYNYNIGKDPLKDSDELYFNLIGTDWDTTIENLRFTIRMPKEFDKSSLGFSSGKYGATDSSNVIYSVDGNVIKGGIIEPLDEYEGVTVRLTLPEGYFVGASNNYFDLYSIILIIVSIVFTIIAYLLWKKYGKDDEVVETIEYYPPENYNSAEIEFFYRGQLTDKGVTSLLIYLANKGYLKIEEYEKKVLFKKEKKFKITKVKEYDGNNEIEKMFFDGLFKSNVSYNVRNAEEIIESAKERGENIGFWEAVNASSTCENVESITEEDLENSFYRVVEKIKSIVNSKENINEMFESKHKGKKIWIMIMSIIILVLVTVKPVVELLGGEVLVFAIIFAIFPIIGYSIMFSAMFNNLSNMPLYVNGKKTSSKASYIAFGLIFGLSFGTVCNVSVFIMAIMINKYYAVAYAIGVICTIILLLLYALMPKRTSYGSKILGRIKGFKMFLETAEKNQLEALVNENPEYFYDILPYTYVLEISDVWIEQFETITNQVISPNWYVGSEMFSVSDFGSFVDRTMTSAQTTMSSSPYSGGGSSGGSSGGGSSGGGSGGGGGGSW